MVGPYLAFTLFQVKHWQPVTTLTTESPICGECADAILADLLYDVVKQAKQSGLLPGMILHLLIWEPLIWRHHILFPLLPDSLAQRPDCWWGSNCRTQKTNAAHAEKYNHVCEQTKKVEKKVIEDARDDCESLPSDYSEEDESCSDSE